MLKIAAAFGIPLTLAAGAAASTSFLVVDVREGGPEGQHLVVPVPMFLARAAVTLAPADKTRVQLPHEAVEHLALVREVIDALAEAPDAELVRVEEGDETVVVAKEGDALHVHVDGSGDRVEVTVPLRAAQRLMAAFDGRTVGAGQLVAALGELSNTDLVDVRSADGDHVRVWVW